MLQLREGKTTSAEVKKSLYKIVYLIFEKHIRFQDEEIYKIIPREKEDEQKNRVKKNNRTCLGMSE